MVKREWKLMSTVLCGTFGTNSVKTLSLGDDVFEDKGF